MGAAGAAIALAASLAAINVYNQFGLARFTPVRGLHPAASKVYLTIVVSAVLLLAVSSLPLLLAVQVAIAILGSAAVVWINRATLRLAGTFPELARVPLVRRLFR